jgi:hypothetical protein
MTSTINKGDTRRRVIAGVVAGASLLTVGGLASGAFFTDATSIDNNEFTFGSVSISTTPSSAPLFTMKGSLPGDSFTGPLLVKNDGTMEMRYALSSIGTNDTVGAALDLVVKTGVTDCTKAGFAGSGTVLYNGDLGLTSGTKVLGDKAVGGQAGDRVVAAGSTDTLCVQVAVPGSVDDSFQGLGSTTQFKFDAEQTRNNA